MLQCSEAQQYGVMTGSQLPAGIKERDDKGVCDLVFLSRYMRPEGPWQRLRRCLEQRRWLFLYTSFPCTRTGLTGHSGSPTPPTIKKNKGKKKSLLLSRQKEMTKERYILGRAWAPLLSALLLPPVLWGHSP